MKFNKNTMRFIKKLFGTDKNKPDADHISSFNEEQAKEEDVQFIDHGVQTIPVEKITGSVGKYYDFDSRFRPKQHVSKKRFNDIKKIMREGGKLPSVNLYQIRNNYYVLDGNHRVAAAKELGQTEIRAKVVELLSGIKTLENIIYVERKGFHERTGLKEDINLTEVGKYNFLEKQIKKHQSSLADRSGDDCDLPKAARDWFNTIYKPLVAIIESGELLQYFPERTIGDLYTYITYHHWSQSPERRYGIGISQIIPKTMDAFRTAMLERECPGYPEMKRTITAFVFINVGMIPENEILETLYVLDEIQEVHSVHGSIDILVKIVLKRDFLTSDAETIAEFVDTKIRRIKGINRTQTIIPGISKVKDYLRI
ncbi:MAG: Lrp/AsnC ligand binding domain-containing protein [Desulfobacterales bacterium]|nr:Lrp/AsnC ligand binding domain-containing protein [Desulfobacterales bacterium]